MRWLLIVIVPSALACSPVRLALPVRGLVIDEHTREPVADAIVELTAESHCFAFPEGFTRTLQVARAKSTRSGRFTLGGGTNVLFPSCFGWETNVAVFAPGYYGSPANRVSDSIGPRVPWPLRTLVPITVRLRRLRYLLPLMYGYQRRDYAYSFSDRGVDGDLDARLRSFSRCSW